MAERAAIVTGASSGIGLAIAHDARRGGLRPDRRRAAAGQARGGGEGLRDKGYEVKVVAGNLGDEDDRAGGRAPRTASASGASTCSSTTRASASARPSRELTTKKIDIQLNAQPALDLPLLPRGRRPAARGRRRAPQRARRQHVVDLRQARRGLAVGLLATKHGVVGFTAGDEQGARARGHQVDRAVPGVRRHADDRLRQGAVPAEEMIATADIAESVRAAAASSRPAA